MITIITGAQSSGKTLKAKEIVKNKPTVWIDGLRIESKFVFTDVNSDTEYVVFDDVSRFKISAILKLVGQEIIEVNKKNVPVWYRKAPHIIVCGNDLPIQKLQGHPHVRFEICNRIKSHKSLSTN